MKNKVALALFASLLLVLGACGTEKAEKEQEKDKVELEEQNAAQSDEIEEQEEEKAEEAEETTPTETPAAKPNKEEAKPAAPATQDGEVIQTDRYAITLLKGYTFMEEEPGRDIVSLSADGQTFMRLEVEEFTQDAYDFYKQNGLELAQAIAGDAEVHTNDPVSLQNAKQAMSYQTKISESTISIFVFEMNGKVVRATIYDEPTEKYTNEFAEMLSTIK
ncbi:hypothetical protein [Savagea faecisuis]|uniref:Uncharacterized protein n=1 Tax=Savagea faecisuis TaxID=1274803 RepID=A0ABW3GYW8_9BACL